MTLPKHLLIPIAAAAVFGIAPASAGVISPELDDSAPHPFAELDTNMDNQVPQIIGRPSQFIPNQSRHALMSLMADPMLLPGYGSSPPAFGNSGAIAEDATDVPEPVAPALVCTGLLLLILRRCKGLFK